MQTFLKFLHTFLELQTRHKNKKINHTTKPSFFYKIIYSITVHNNGTLEISRGKNSENNNR